jgi:hypothetical protein
MAKNMSFSGRFGNSCGIPFEADKFFKEHRQYEKFAPYIFDRLSQPWTDFSIEKSKGKLKGLSTEWDYKEGIWLKRMNAMTITRGEIVKLFEGPQTSN